MKLINLKSKLFKTILLPTASIVSISAASISNVTHVRNINNSSSILKADTSLTFDADIKNTVNFQEVNYWHDTEPEAKVTAVQTLPIQFNFTTSSIIANCNNTRNIAGKQITSDVKQVTAFQTNENSGSYLFKDKTNEEKRVVNWERIITDYLTYQVSRSYFNWGDCNTNLLLDVQKTWDINTSINCVEGDIVYIDDQVHNNRNHDFWFSRGISKDMCNESYHVWAIPYAYAKEIQFIYGAYNYVARYLYTLQANNDFHHTTFDIGTNNLFPLSNNLSYMYDLSQLISINSVVYSANDQEPAQLVFGFNPDIVSLLNKTINLDYYEFLSFASQFADYSTKYYRLEDYLNKGLINVDNLDQLKQCKSCEEIIAYCDKNYMNDETYQTFHKYNFKQSSSTVKMLNTLLNKMNLKLYVTTYDHSINDYIGIVHEFSAKQLWNEQAKVDVYKNPDNEYCFQVNNMEVVSDKQPHVLIAYANDDYDNQYSIDTIVKHKDNEQTYYTIEQPKYCDVDFYPEKIESKLKSKLPSQIIIDDLINKAIVFRNDDGPVELDKNQYYLCRLIPNDIDGTIKAVASINAKTPKSQTFEGFKNFDYSKHMDIDIDNTGYIISSNVSDDIIWQILLKNGWIDEVKDEYDIIEKEPDLQTGILKFRFRSKKVNNIIDELNYKQIIIRGFEPFYVKYKTDSDYLKQHQAKDVKEKDVRQNLLEPSIGYLHTYGNDYECKITECSEKENYIVVQIPFEQSVQKQTFQFAFSEEQSVSQLSTGTIICIVILTAGVVALVLTLSIHFIRNKKREGFNGQNKISE